ncbi:MAG: hypothetical protein ACRETG_01290, partial [Steroidobacteraceae bacterium]
MKSGLPIDAALPALREALRTHRSAVLQAPPGAGKSTVVPLARAALLEEFADRLKSRDSVAWSTREQAVIARRTLALDALVLEDQPLTDVPVEVTRDAMLAGVRELGLAALAWDRE